MPERTVQLSELVGKNLLEVGAGRPRSVTADYGPLPILRVADVLDGRIETAEHVQAGIFDRRTLGPKVSQPGDIVLTVKGTVGRVAMMPLEGSIFSYSPQLCYFRPLVNGPLVPRYLYYWFKSEEFWVQANVVKGQTDMADFISLGDVSSLKMRLPSVAEQRAVSEVLGALDDKITVNERIAAASEALALALASPERWESRVRLDGICALRKVQVTPVEITEAAVDHYSLPAFDSGKIPAREDPAGIKSGKFLVQGTAVLLSKLNPEIPRVWNVLPEVGVPALASTEFLVLAPIGGVSSDELWSVAAQSTFRNELASKVTGTSKSHQRVRPAEVMASEVVDPRHFGADGQKIQNLSGTASAMRKEAATLSALRDTLLPQLMSGRLRVKDAEKIVEDHV